MRVPTGQRTRVGDTLDPLGRQARALPVAGVTLGGHTGRCLRRALA
jgi:hypothetical protein